MSYRTSSNYPTAHNHCFRSVSSYDAQSHTKRKCSTCGVWGKKGGTCTLCGDTIPAPRPHHVASMISSRVLSYVSFTGAEAAVTEAASQSWKDEETSPLAAPPQKTPKVKCSYCGIWVTPASVCHLCRTQA
ncbi:uncharacterized protein TM35_000071380 [Trypanosoma theileri]|uniref:Uncharacterized protein n=1 Tax=Trypanosoma theileri TaxID=67003 RepID=A0A1X0P195_9TRYP|nr:uncharacterized protein TM35_000071380 [Trypanosoma theileri]ORC90714.1 hypothetical protein TM35_000071380 [Trypanosoma theileri]